MNTLSNNCIKCQVMFLRKALYNFYSLVYVLVDILFLYSITFLILFLKLLCINVLA